MTKPNELVCGDTICSMSDAYIQGARDARDGVSYHANPYSDGSQRECDWDYGHTNEHAYEHFRFGLDLLAEVASGRTFEEDAQVPRDDLDQVDSKWGLSQLESFNAGQAA